MEPFVRGRYSRLWEQQLRIVVRCVYRWVKRVLQIQTLAGQNLFYVRHMSPEPVNDRFNAHRRTRILQRGYDILWA